MAQILSKEDEKKILSKIVKMVEGISENKDNSYIRIAFEGFEAMALNNIEYDMGDSVMTWVEVNRKVNEEVRILERQFNEMSKDYENALAIITTDKEKMDEYRKQLEEAHELKEKTMDNLQGIIDTLDAKIGNMAKALEEVTASKDLEIMKLKAEIYDLKK